ncbi:MAG: gamma-glutamyl-gamma-aminobutyrate hydrolase family protein [Magnetococcales bacterium]|nr:gamma-glutamyl-gamma-aminobutyrate hydrolase family protein [Magnetococcales bacterium]
MKIGYLRAGFTPPQLLGPFDDYVELFRRVFARHWPEAVLRLYEVQRLELPRSPDECDVYLCSGSSSSVFDPEPWIPPLLDMTRRIVQAGRPFLGICFGHQLIAQALGGRVERATGGWGLGVKTLQITEHLPWMTPKRDVVRLHFCHQDQVVRLPPGGRVIGVTGHCPVAALAVGQHCLGIQGHPEFDRDLMTALLDLLDKTVAPTVMAQARESLAMDVDNDLLGRWMGTLFRTGCAPGG